MVNDIRAIFRNVMTTDSNDERIMIWYSIGKKQRSIPKI